MRDSDRRRRRKRHRAGARCLLIAGTSFTASQGESMSKLPAVLAKLPLPIIGSPLFIISNPEAGDRAVQGRRGRLDAGAQRTARPKQLDEWLAEITETLAAWDKRASRARRPRRSRSTRSCTRATTGSSTTCRSAPEVQGADRDHLAGRAHRRQRRGALSWGGIVVPARHHQQRLREEGDREGRRRPDRRGHGRRRPRGRQEPDRA